MPLARDYPLVEDVGRAVAVEEEGDEVRSGHVVYSVGRGRDGVRMGL